MFKEPHRAAKARCGGGALPGRRERSQLDFIQMEIALESIFTTREPIWLNIGKGVNCRVLNSDIKIRKFHSNMSH